MTNQEAKKQAPSYLRLPDDGAAFHCSMCKKETPHNKMILAFTPDEKPHMACCEDCMDPDWMANAKDCGVVE